jgi:hypothetical protein
MCAFARINAETNMMYSLSMHVRDVKFLHIRLCVSLYFQNHTAANSRILVFRRLDKRTSESYDDGFNKLYAALHQNTVTLISQIHWLIGRKCTR